MVQILLATVPTGTGIEVPQAESVAIGCSAYVYISVSRIVAIAAGCKPALFGVRWFESNLTDQAGVGC